MSQRLGPKRRTSSHAGRRAVWDPDDEDIEEN